MREPPPVYTIVFNISGGTFSQFNAVETVQNMANRLTALSIAEGQPDLARALRELGQAVLSERGLDERTRGELVENVDYLSEQAELPPGQRKQGRVRAAIATISAAATAGTQLQEAWVAWGQIIQELLSH